MIKVMIAALISLMSFAPIMAQNIKGKIENTKGEPLAFVNVVLLTRGDISWRLFLSWPYLEISCQCLLCRQDRGTQNRLQYRLLLVW